MRWPCVPQQAHGDERGQSGDQTGGAGSQSPISQHAAQRTPHPDPDPTLQPGPHSQPGNELPSLSLTQPTKHTKTKRYKNAGSIKLGHYNVTQNPVGQDAQIKQYIDSATQNDQIKMITFNLFLTSQTNFKF